MRIRAKKGRLLGTILGTTAGFLVSYAIWGSEMWTWGVPSGIPILICMATGSFLGYALIDAKSQAERDWDETLFELAEVGVGGLLVGTGIGLAMLAIPAFVGWLLFSVPGTLCVMITLVGASIGAVTGFLSSASTRYRRPE